MSAGLDIARGVPVIRFVNDKRPQDRPTPEFDALDELIVGIVRDFDGPPRAEDPTDPTLPACEALEQIGFSGTRIIDSCDRPGSEAFDGHRVCPGHKFRMERQREIERTTPIAWTSQGRIYQ